MRGHGLRAHVFVRRRGSLLSFRNSRGSLLYFLLLCIETPSLSVSPGAHLRGVDSLNGLHVIGIRGGGDRLGLRPGAFLTDPLPRGESFQPPAAKKKAAGRGGNELANPLIDPL